METDPALDLLHQAIQNGDYIAFIVAAVVVITAFVLKVLGKKIPLVDTLLDVVIKGFNAIRGVKKLAPPAEPPKGIGGVVKVEDEQPK